MYRSDDKSKSKDKTNLYVNINTYKQQQYLLDKHEQ